MTPASRPAIVKIAVVDDHPIVIRGLRQLLIDSRFQIVWEAQRRQQCLELYLEIPPEIVILDLRLGDDLAPDVLRELRASGGNARCVILTGHEDAQLLRACLDGGASGILLKDSLELQIVRGLERVMAGEVVLDHRLQAIGAAKGRLGGAGGHEEDLTAREHDVLRLVARGMTSRQISADLDLSLNTVRSYVQSVMTKLDAHTRTEAVTIARRMRLV